MRASGSWIWPTTPPSSVLSHHVWRSPLRYEDSVFPLLCMCVCLCVCVCLWLTNCMWHDISRASLSLHSLCVIYMQRVWQLCSQFVFGYLIAIIRLFCDGVLLPFFCACVCSLFYLVFLLPFFKHGFLYYRSTLRISARSTCSWFWPIWARMPMRCVRCLRRARRCPAVVATPAICTLVRLVFSFSVNV